MRFPLLMAFAATSGLAQSSVPLAFEAASVKPTAPESRGSSLPNPGGARFNAAGVTLKDLIVTAYHIQDLQISGGPAWLGSARFDVTATAGFRAKPDQVRQMLRSLLADQFHLVARNSTKDLSYFALLPAKSGAKMAKSDQQDCPDIHDISHPCGGFKIYQRREVTAYAATMDQFAESLSWLMAHVVEDKTGLDARYDFKLTFTPDSSLGPMTSEKPDLTQADQNAGSIFAAIQEQLGLKLESRKGPVPILVIDRAEKPSTP